MHTLFTHLAHTCSLSISLCENFGLGDAGARVLAEALKGNTTLKRLMYALSHTLTVSHSHYISLFSLLSHLSSLYLSSYLSDIAVGSKCKVFVYLPILLLLLLLLPLLLRPTSITSSINNVRPFLFLTRFAPLPASISPTSVKRVRVPSKRCSLRTSILQHLVGT
jgi:hypothetical protein